MKKLVITILSVTLYLLFTSCEYQRLTMPNSNDTSTIFNTGEIKYIQMNPIWTNFEYPVDMYVSLDDYIFVADSIMQEVVVLDKTGQRVISDESGNNFEDLQNLSFSPMGICVDSKLNLFVVDKSNKLYTWNQFTNNKSETGDGNDSLAVSIRYKNISSGETETITDFSESYALEDDGYIIDKVMYEYNPAKSDSILDLHEFFADNDESTTPSKFVAVAAAPSTKNAVYVTDTGEQTILKINYVRSAYLKLADGTTVWQHRGERGRTIANAGTGAGTVNDPTGIFVDPSGSVFYTQTGINFGFHKIAETNEEEQIWSSMFLLGQNEILDLERFIAPQDVAVDEDGNIFVLNTGANEVQVFESDGSFLRKAGLRSVQIDTTIMSMVDGQSVEKDTIITKYYNDVLNDPRGIFVDNGVVYVVNSGDNNIIRFKLSSDLDVEIEE